MKDSRKGPLAWFAAKTGNEAYFEKFDELLDDPGLPVDNLGDIGVCKFIQTDFDPDNDTLKFDFLSHELQEAADAALGEDFFNL